MTSVTRKLIPAIGAILCAILGAPGGLTAQDNTGGRASSRVNPAAEAVSDVLPPEAWKRVDAGTARAIKWLATQQEADGSFPTMEMGEPGVTSLCVLAFMAHGHHPGEGEHGQRLERAIEFILSSCQKENGLVCVLGPDGPTIRRNVQHEIGQTAVYNHAIASLTLAEIYGMGHSRQAEQIQKVIDKSLAATLEMQRWPKDRGAIDEGGWRYINSFDADDSDLSITGWSLMFLRSARNAGFEVPDKSIDDAVEYVQHCFSDEYGAHGYVAGPGDHRSRGMAGAGILALAHAGYHDSEQAKRTGKWLLDYTFEVYNSDDGLPRDRYHYSLFNCCQGMYQLGSPYWEQFFPWVVGHILKHQESDGSWEPESYHLDRPFGDSYTTALVLLALSPPNEILPIFQR